MNYYMIVEPLIQEKFWCQKYSIGIKEEVNKSKGTLIETTAKDYIRQKPTAERAVVILNCISRSWIIETTRELFKHNVHSLLIAPIVSVPLHCSSVSFDFFHIFYDLCRYLFQSTHNKIALVGVNRTSVNDLTKKSAFERFKLHYQVEQKDDIFFNTGSLDQCCEDFYKNISRFSAVVCTNDIVAFKLIHFLKARNISVPNDIYVATMGNTTLGRFTKPRITVADFDCELIGKQTAKMYKILTKNPEISSLSATVSGEIIPMESTNYEKVHLPQEIPYTATKENINFYSDEDVQKIFQAEHLLSHCEEIDLQLLQGMILGHTIVKLAAELYLTEYAIKYRIARMKKLAGVSNRKALIALVSHFILPGNEQLPTSDG